MTKTFDGVPENGGFSERGQRRAEVFERLFFDAGEGLFGSVFGRDEGVIRVRVDSKIPAGGLSLGLRFSALVIPPRRLGRFGPPTPRRGGRRARVADGLEHGRREGNILSISRSGGVDSGSVGKRKRAKG